jgi:hypothetical protein
MTGDSERQNDHLNAPLVWRKKIAEQRLLERV